jgi:hypothetical protein
MPSALVTNWSPLEAVALPLGADEKVDLVALQRLLESVATSKVVAGIGVAEVWKADERCTTRDAPLRRKYVTQQDHTISLAEEHGGKRTG